MFANTNTVSRPSPVEFCSRRLQGRFARAVGWLSLCALILGFVALPPANAQNGLVSWWPGNGNYNDVVSGNNGTPYGGVGFLRGRYGEAFGFDGVSGRIFVPDSSSLALTGSMAISAWIKVASYPASEGQILFRGDDRGGYDPYYLEVDGDGDLQYQIADANNAQVWAFAPVPLAQWVFVAATLDDNTGIMSLYENGKLMDYAKTNVRPFANLDSSQNPGVGIGNTQGTQYSEYFHGIIDDLKLYDTTTPGTYPTAVSLRPNSVVGGNAVHATVQMNDSPLTGANVTLNSSSPNATVPSSITSHAGYYSAAFVIQTKPVSSTQTVTITATKNGISAKTTLTLTP